MDDDHEAGGRRTVVLCAVCGRIRVGGNDWSHVDGPDDKDAGAVLTHGLCPECMRIMYGDQDWYAEYEKRVLGE